MLVLIQLTDHLHLQHQQVMFGLSELANHNGSVLLHVLLNYRLLLAPIAAGCCC
jgi:hypothetical protein